MPGPAALSEPYHSVGYQVSRLTVANCDGSDKQKWNAPPVLQTNGVSNYAEDRHRPSGSRQQSLRPPQQPSRGRNGFITVAEPAPLDRAR